MTTSSTSHQAVPIAWVESLFARMSALYGNKFLDMWRGSDMEMVKGLWAHEMGKMSHEELKRGYDSLLTREWPPTLPEYAKLCKPPVDPTIAYYQAIEGLAERDRGSAGVWPHPAIFWTAARMRHELMSQGYSAMKDRWAKALEMELAKGQWEPVPQPAPALPSPTKSELSRAQAKRVLEDLGATSIVANACDPKRWAKKIMERVAAGEVMPEIAVRFAKEALAEKYSYAE